MKFSTKLFLIFSCVILFMVTIGLSSRYFYTQIKDRVISEGEEAVEKLEHSEEMGLNLYQSIIQTENFLKERYRGDTSNLDDEEVMTLLNTTERRVVQVLEEIESDLDQSMSVSNSQAKSVAADSITDDARLILEEFDEKYRIYRSLLSEFFELSRADYSDGAEFFDTTIEPYFSSNLIPIIDEMRENAKHNMDLNIETLNTDVAQYNLILLTVTISFLFISLGLAYYLYRSISAPVIELASAAKKIGEGDLEKKIRIDTNDEIGQLADEFNRMVENLSKTTFSKDYVDNILESMGEALIVTDNKFIIKRVNKATLKMLGYTESDLVGKSIKPLLLSKDHSKIASTTGGNIENYESHYISRTGEQIPVSMSRATMLNSNGEVKGIVCVASDVTDRKKVEQQVKKSLKEKEILLAEIHHRVKNNLAVISGLLQMQIWETEHEAAETALRDSQLRVQSIALVHEKLYQSENLSYIELDKYIRDLLQAISGTYIDAYSGIDIKTELEPVVLNINQAIPCSLLLNELIVNAYKHAFEPEGSGNICVFLTKEADEVHLKVHDDGTGMPEDFSLDASSSLGMSLIDTLVDQLSGNISYYNNEGAVFDISFRAEEVM